MAPAVTKIADFKLCYQVKQGREAQGEAPAGLCHLPAEVGDSERVLLPWVSSPTGGGLMRWLDWEGRKDGQKRGVGAILTLQMRRIREGVDIKRALNGEEP